MVFDERMLEFERIRALLASLCISELGRRRVAEMQPQVDREALERDMILVREMMTLLSQRIEPPIHNLRDVAGHVKRVARERAVLEPLELLDLKEFLETATRMRKFFESHAWEVPHLSQMASSLEALPSLQRSIDEKIAPDGTVRDSASEALRALRRDIFAIEQRIQSTLHKMIRELTDSGDLQDSFYTLRNNRYVLPVKTTNRSRVPGLIHDSSNTGETVFIEPYVILEDSNRLSELRVKEREEIFRILLRVAGHIRDEMPALQTNLVLLAEFDFIYAKARFGCQYDCTFPRLQAPGSPLNLVNAHHPLLRVAAGEQSRPLTLQLEPKNKVLVITGPNAGGKTTALKTIGLTVLMTQCAIPVPLHADSRVPIFSSVLADIGDEQSVLDGMSTFSAHMQRIATILQKVSKASLVLLDELGTATDPGEGGALAVAILERLAETSGLTVVSTHLAALKNWAAEHPAGRNASFRLSERDHRPTFHLILDLPGISEALVIAEQVGLPHSIIERARALRPSVEHDATALLMLLQAKEEELKQRLEQVAREQEELEIMRVQLAEERQKLEQTRRNLKRELLAEKEEAIRQAKAKVEELIARQPTKRQLAELRGELENEIRQTVAQRKTLREPLAIDPDELVEGVRVHLRTLNDFGEIVKVSREKEELRVEIRGRAVRVPFSEVDAIVKQPQEQQSSGAIVYARRQDVPISIDLHGKRVEEALSLVEKHLDNALIAGLGFVRIVHGHGKGVLSEAIHDYLRSLPFVKSFRYGTPSEGGAAVTIVEFS